MKLARLTDSNFQTAVKKLLTQKLPVKTAYKLRGIAKIIEEELAKYDSVRKLTLEKYGKKKEDGSLDLKDGVVQFEGDDIKKFVSELGELTSLDVDIPTISVDELGDVEISAEELIYLDGLVV